jgi:hypothetical protein
MELARQLTVVTLQGAVLKLLGKCSSGMSGSLSMTVYSSASLPPMRSCFLSKLTTPCLRWCGSKSKSWSISLYCRTIPCSSGMSSIPALILARIPAGSSCKRPLFPLVGNKVPLFHKPIVLFHFICSIPVKDMRHAIQSALSLILKISEAT